MYIFFTLETGMNVIDEETTHLLIDDFACEVVAENTGDTFTIDDITEVTRTANQFASSKYEDNRTWCVEITLTLEKELTDTEIVNLAEKVDSALIEIGDNPNSEFPVEYPRLCEVGIYDVAGNQTLLWEPQLVEN